MASVNHPPVSVLGNARLSALAHKVSGWLSDGDNLAKTGIPQSAADELEALDVNFKAANIVCENKGTRTQSDITHRNNIRKKLVTWFRDYFTSGVVNNTKRVSNADRIRMGWYPTVPPRKSVPPPTAQTALEAEVHKNGSVDVTVSHSEKAHGKPRDADGLELVYALEDPNLQPDTVWFSIGRYTKVHTGIALAFPAECFGRNLWMRGHWYNHNGVSQWSEVITFTLQRQ